jgi:hypothetical protein
VDRFFKAYGTKIEKSTLNVLQRTHLQSSCLTAIPGELLLSSARFRLTVNVPKLILELYIFKLSKKGGGYNIITEEMLPKRFSDTEASLVESYEMVLKQHCLAVYKKYEFDIAKTCKALGYKNSTQFKSKLMEWSAYNQSSK